MLVKASIAGAIVTNTLFMLGASFLLGGLKYHTQEYNRGQRAAAGGPAVPGHGRAAGAVGGRPRGSARRDRTFMQTLSVGLSVLLIVRLRAGAAVLAEDAPRVVRRPAHGEEGERRGRWRSGAGTLAVVTVLVALVSEIFVESVQQAAETFGMTPAFVGFIVVALVGGAAEMASAFSGARKNRLDLSVGIALGSASQIALFVAPVLVLLSYVIGPTPMDLQFWPGAVVMMLIAALTRAGHEQRPRPGSSACWC